MKVSTTDAVTKCLQYHYDNIDGCHIAVSISLIYTEAFDWVDHGILHQKLRAYVTHDDAWKWNQHYITDRHQYVSIYDAIFPLCNIDGGVLQGSSFGPL